MPNYTSPSLMMLSYPPIGSLSTVTSFQMSRYADEVEALIDAKISRMYTVPVSPTPPALEAITTTLAVWQTLIKRQLSASGAKEHPWAEPAKQAWDWIEKIATGAVALVVSGGALVAGRTDFAEVWSNNKDYLPTYADGLQTIDSVVDPNKEDDDYAARN